MGIEVVTTGSRTISENITHLIRDVESGDVGVEIDFGPDKPEFIVLMTSSLRKAEVLKRTVTGERTRVGGEELTIAEFQQRLNRTMYNGNGALPDEAGVLELCSVKGVKILVCASGGETKESLPVEAANEKLEYGLSRMWNKVVRTYGTNGIVLTMDTELTDGTVSFGKVMDKTEAENYRDAGQLEKYLVAKLRDAVNLGYAYRSVTGIAAYDLRDGRYGLDEVHYPVPMTEVISRDSQMVLDPYASLATVGQQQPWEWICENEDERWGAYAGSMGCPVEVLELAARMSRERVVK